MDDRERAIRQRLKDDYVHYAPRCLKIRTKAGHIEPLALNKAQLYLHEKAEQQLKEKGRVRILVLKGRQQGISTYIEGRLYHKVTHRSGVRAFILTHEQEATNNLFEMAQRYHEYCPELVKPQIEASNAKELIFGLLDSGYKIGTALNKSVGRSSTIQYFHGSEVAFWANAAEHAKGILQAIPDQPNTEVFLESTANGLGNYFHQQWQLAENGQSEFIAVFIPWFWQDEYAKPIEGEFTLTDEELELKAAYNLSIEQLNWRRVKIIELSADGVDGSKAFKQEYPCTASEAFQTSGDSLIPSNLVAKARKTFASESGALIVGIDMAFEGDDRTAIIRRRGRVAYKLEVFSDIEPMTLVGRIVEIIKTEKPSRIFADISGATGHLDRLREMGYGEIVKGINFGSASLYPEKYANKRAEMWCEMLAWFKDEPVQIPDSDVLHTDICAPQRKNALDSKSRIVIESKESIRKRGLLSPDAGDALALTFAFPVGENTDKPLKYPNMGIV